MRGLRSPAVMRMLRLTLLAVVGTAALFAACHIGELWNAQRTDFAAEPHLAFSGQPADVAAGAKMMPAVQVTVVDTAGRPATSFRTSITLALATNPSGGKLLATITAAPVNGVATFSDIRLDNAGSGYTLMAQAVGAVSDTSAPFAVLPGAVAELSFTVQPSNALEGAPINPPVELVAYDAWGNMVTTLSGTVTVAIGKNGGLRTQGRLLGSTATVPAKGRARFQNLSIDQYGNGYTLMGVLGTVKVESARFDVAARQASKLAFSAQPQSTSRNRTLSPVKVSAVDNSGSTVTGYVGTITIALGANPGGADLSGTLTVPAVNGVATLSDLRLNQRGSGYTLTASASGLAGSTSARFDIR